MALLNRQLPREAGRVLGVVVHGYEVYYDPDTDQLAHARGVGPRKQLVVGPIWWTLRNRERWAILLHEVAHCRHFHLEWRILLIPLFWTRLVMRMAARQELQADAFVAEQGYGAELLAVLQRFPAEDGPYYPTIEDRCHALRECIREHAHAVAA